MGDELGSDFSQAILRSPSHAKSAPTIGDGLQATKNLLEYSIVRVILR